MGLKDIKTESNLQTTQVKGHGQAGGGGQGQAGGGQGQAGGSGSGWGSVKATYLSFFC